MAPAWSRLIRYRATDSSTHYGEPLLNDSDEDINDLLRHGKLRARRCEGKSVLDAVPTEASDQVVELLALLQPEDVPYIRCIGLNYKTHILETGRSLPVNPSVFSKPGTCVAGPGAAIPIPKIAQEQCDYEGELTILIGADAKNVSPEDALGYVAGYTVGNDVSARDWQREHDKAGPVPQWGFSKSFDDYAPIGPMFVSPKVLGAADSLELKTSVNGQLRQHGNTADLCFGVKALVSFLSQGQTLQAGSLIMTGTPGGVGLFMKPPVFLKNGDEVVIEIRGIGRLQNTMMFE